MNKDTWIGIIILLVSIWLGSWLLQFFSDNGEYPVFPTLPIIITMSIGIVCGFWRIMASIEVDSPRW